MMSGSNASPLIIFDARILFGSGHAALWKPFEKIMQQAYREFVPESRHAFPIETINRLSLEDLKTLNNVVDAAVLIAHEEAVKNGASIRPGVNVNNQKLDNWVQICLDSMTDLLRPEACDFLDHLTDFQEKCVDRGQTIDHFMFVVPYPFFQELLKIAAPELEFTVNPIPANRMGDAKDIKLRHPISHVHVISSDPKFLGGSGLKATLPNGREIPVDMHSISSFGQNDRRATPEALMQIMKDAETWVPQPENVVVPASVLIAAREARAALLSKTTKPIDEAPRQSTELPMRESIAEHSEWIDDHLSNPPQHQIFLNMQTGLKERVALRMVQDAMRTAYDLASATLCPEASQEEVLNKKEKRHPADNVLFRRMQNGESLPAAEEMIKMIEARLKAEHGLDVVSLGSYGREQLVDQMEEIYWKSVEKNIEPCLSQNFIKFCAELRDLQEKIVAIRAPVDFAIVAPTSADAILTNAMMPMDTGRIFIVPVDGPDDHPIIPWPRWSQTSFSTISNSPNFGIKLTQGQIDTAYVVVEDRPLDFTTDKPSTPILGSAETVIEALYKRLGIKQAERPNNNNRLVKASWTKSINSEGPDVA